ncbi:carboxymuconolactone decarboxylase family protein [Phyllobacterium sp. 21LDTY02-6]|uniref:carboxymuconolactone decarboxylase family protein n=1 Tax=Phyllobacterium sp. 21LDTY02-6 TaxID=2944903 RepID=UPI0020209436|nr:carboxymuconolactone decarboxylase family protein [Phyllobacterium sp. 21LDTY02-6]MCO4319786.1 carboxymuconolactone decarboxylase family protein [Phyllobacterium sp. 21LDTY02-6]
MKPRLVPYKYHAIEPMLRLEESVAANGIETSLAELVKIRASQINSCAYCLDMHNREAREKGESEQRLYLLAGWRESPLYTDRERAALAWTETLTLVAQTHAPDEEYEALKRHFSEEEIVKLTMLIVTINGWNRICVGFRAIHAVEGDRAAA